MAIAYSSKTDGGIIQIVLLLDLEEKCAQLFVNDIHRIAHAAGDIQHADDGMPMEAIHRAALAIDQRQQSRVCAVEAPDLQIGIIGYGTERARGMCAMLASGIEIDEFTA